MGFLVKLFVGLVGLYAIVAGILTWMQRDLMYSPDRTHVTPAAKELEGVEEHRIRTPDGQSLVAWYRPAVVGGVTVLYFPGNAGSIADRGARFAEFYGKASFGVLAVNYRGYGGSTGKPTEDGLIADGLAAYDWLAKRHKGDIAIYGESLGAAVAVAVAEQRKTYALILESGASSLVAVAQRAYPWLPVWFLMFDRFRSDERIAKVRAPLLMLHGEEDAVVPIDLGRDLFKMANDPKNFAPFIAAGHNDLWQHNAGKAAIEFLQAVQKPPI